MTEDQSFQRFLPLQLIESRPISPFSRIKCAKNKVITPFMHVRLQKHEGCMLLDAKDCSKHIVCSQKIVVERIITTNLSKGTYHQRSRYVF